MSNNELQYIQYLIQLHLLLSEGRMEDDEVLEILHKMEAIQVDSGVMNLISSYLAALLIPNLELRKRYRELLFAFTHNTNELDRIFSNSSGESIDLDIDPITAASMTAECVVRSTDLGFESSIDFEPYRDDPRAEGRELKEVGNTVLESVLKLQRLRRHASLRRMVKDFYWVEDEG